MRSMRTVFGSGVAARMLTDKSNIWISSWTASRRRAAGLSVMMRGRVEVWCGCAVGVVVEVMWWHGVLGQPQEA